MGHLNRPAPLTRKHNIETFCCNRPQLDDWLEKRALSAMESGTARTFVVCRGAKNVVGYFSLAAGAVEHASAPGSLKRNAPDPIPVIILARLAVSSEEQRRGLGKSLLADAMKRAAKAATQVGARALIVHALDEDAANFYAEHGFGKMSGEAYFIAMKTIFSSL